MWIENETFNEYRVQQRKIQEAIKLLRQNKYTVEKNKVKNDTRTTNRRDT